MEERLPDTAAKGSKIAGRTSARRAERLSVRVAEARQLFQALIEGAKLDGATCVFSFTWLHPGRTTPAADYVMRRLAVSGLIGAGMGPGDYCRSSKAF